MTRLSNIVAALVVASSLAWSQAAERANNCVTCHGLEAKLAATSVHGKAGVDCITCHGGVDHEIDVAKAHVGMKKLDDPRDAVASCGTCHSDLDRMRTFGLRTDQLSLYWTSRHGQKLAADGDPNVATCVTCHGSHDVLHVRDPRSLVHARNQIETCGACHGDAKLMGQYGLPSDVVTQYRSSVHGRALHDDNHSAAPSCTDCHGSHGALPPRTADVEMVCGQCHTVVQNFYDSSPHATSGGAKNAIQCTACHDNHGTTRPSSRCSSATKKDTAEVVTATKVIPLAPPQGDCTRTSNASSRRSVTRSSEPSAPPQCGVCSSAKSADTSKKRAVCSCVLAR
jgi:hypothetical protein